MLRPITPPRWHSALPPIARPVAVVRRWWRVLNSALLRSLLAVLELRMARAVLRQLALVIAPLAVALMACKAYKVVYALWPVTGSTLGWHRPTALQALLQIATAPASIALALAALLVCLLNRRRLPGRPRQACLITGGLALALVATKLVHASITNPAGASALGLSALERVASGLVFALTLFRADLYLLLGCAVVAAACLLTGRQHHGRTVSLGLQAISLLLAGVCALELANYEKTGLNGTGSLLIYAIRNAAGVAGMVSSEADTKLWVALLIPPGMWMLCWGLLRASQIDAPSVGRAGGGGWHKCLRSIRHPGQHGGLAAGNSAARPAALRTGLIVWPALVCTALLPPPQDQQYLRLRGNTLAMLGYDVAVRPWLGGGGHQLPASLDRAGGPTSFVASAGAGARPLNVVIVMLESVRASATSVYAPALHTTPYLAELANSSLVVDQMYAVIPRTSAAWVAILQGLVPSTNSALMTWAIRQATASDSPSLPRLLRPHGYRSAFFVPTHLNYENEGQIIRNMGFDQVVSLDHFKGVQRVNYFGVEDRHLLGPVMDWVDQADRDHQPFVLSIMTNVGHHKYDVPQTWPHRTYSPSSDPDFNNYLNCVAYIDNFLRELMAGLATRRVLDSSVVLIVGDHGEAFGEHGARQHAMSLYEESLHVPMLIHAPRLYPRGGRVGGVRQQIDIVPTVAELLGLQMTGARLPGSSLLQPVPADRRLYFSSILEDVALGLRVGSHKYIYNFGRTPTEAYELDSDPAERHDKANTLSAAGRRAIESDLQDWYERGRQAMVH